jgi:fatty-acyl-CoA synthase
MQSYVHSTGREPLSGHTVGQVLDDAARRWPDGEALVVPHQQVRWSWRELQRRSRACGAGLLALGLMPGDRIGILAPNLAEWVVTQFGTAYAGLILVNINPAYRRAELEYALNKVACKALILAPALKTSDYLAILNDLAPELRASAPGKLAAKALPPLRTVIRLGAERTPGMMNFDEVAARGGAAERKRLAELAGTLQFDDPINI